MQSQPVTMISVSATCSVVRGRTRERRVGGAEDVDYRENVRA